MQMELWLQERLDLGTQTWHQESLSVSRESSFLCGGFIQVHILSLKFAMVWGNFLAVQWLGLQAVTDEGPGSIPGGN